MKIRFSISRLEALTVPPGQKRLRVYDEDVKGLLVDVRANGSKTFYVRRKLNNVSVWERIGPFPDITIEYARACASKFNFEVATGKDPIAARAAAKQELTLGELFEQYIERHAKKQNRKTCDAMASNFNRTLSMWRGTKLSAIQMEDVERLHGTLAHKRGIYSANRSLQLLRAMYNKAITWKLFAGPNPATGITLFKEKSRERFLSQDEIKKLFEKLYGPETPRDLKDFVLLAILTGARRNNLLSMSWNEIDFDAKTWTIPETKNGTSQTIALTDRELQILRERLPLRRNEFVFYGEGASGHLECPKKSWQSLRTRAELHDVTIHDLRRNLGSWMASNNVNVALIKSALNHKDIKTTISVYARTTRDSERDGRETAHNAMFRAAGLPVEQGEVVTLKAEQQAISKCDAESA